MMLLLLLLLLLCKDSKGYKLLECPAIGDELSSLQSLWPYACSQVVNYKIAGLPVRWVG